MSLPSLDRIPERYDDRLAPMDDGELFERLAKEVLREEPQLREQMLGQLRDWIAKHPHIRLVRTDAIFLLRFLRARKYNLIGACKLLERYLATMGLHRKWFGMEEDPEIYTLIEGGFLYPLLERDAKGRTLVVGDMSVLDPAKYTARHCGRLHRMTMEILLESNEMQCAGLVLVYDFSKVTLGHMNLMSLNDIRLLAKAINNALPIRTQELHFANTPSAALTIANFALQLANEKLRNRIFCHRSWDELHAKVDKNLLPKEFGGKIPQLELIESFKKRCKEMRPLLSVLDKMDMEISEDSEYWKESNDGELDAGAIGTFRKLQVD